MDKAPKPGTRRRFVLDMLVARPVQWIDFNSQELGYPSGRCDAIRSDLASLRNIYNLDIRAAGARHPGICRWRYVPLSVEAGYHEVIALTERLHRQFLEVVKLARRARHPGHQQRSGLAAVQYRRCRDGRR